MLFEADEDVQQAVAVSVSHLHFPRSKLFQAFVPIFQRILVYAYCAGPLLRPLVTPLAPPGAAITKFMLKTPEIRGEGPPPQSVSSDDPTHQDAETPQQWCMEEKEVGVQERRPGSVDLAPNIVGVPPRVHPLF